MTTKYIIQPVSTSRVDKAIEFFGSEESAIHSAQETARHMVRSNGLAGFIAVHIFRSGTLIGAARISSFAVETLFDKAK
jgi:hypothetical protein